MRNDKDRVTLKPHETMAITGFGRSYTYALLRKGVMPSIKVGKRFFVPRAALLHWLESCGGKYTAA
jgi:excisionase family DNA binding protein